MEQTPSLQKTNSNDSNDHNDRETREQSDAWKIISTNPEKAARTTFLDKSVLMLSRLVAEDESKIKSCTDARNLRLSIHLSKPPKFTNSNISKFYSEKGSLLSQIRKNNFKVKNYAQNFL
jgi:hypothetical protein